MRSIVWECGSAEWEELVEENAPSTDGSMIMFGRLIDMIDAAPGGRRWRRRWGRWDGGG